MIVDDDPFVQEALKLLLEHSPGLELAGLASTGIDAVRTFENYAPDVILLDLQMPGMDGLATLDAFSKLGTLDLPRIIVLTSYAKDSDVFSALRAGASGFLLKDTEPAGIAEAIRTVHDGQALLSPAVTTQLIREYRYSQRRVPATAELSPEFNDMTEREIQVARAVAQGKSNSDIAAELFMSVSTVKTNVSRIMIKLGVANRVQLALIFHGVHAVDHSL